MSADDGVGAHRALGDVGEVHRAALPAQEAALAPHQLAQHARHRRAARERVGVPPVGAEGPVIRSHRHAEAGGNGLLPERKMARALDQVLQEEVVSALLAVAQLELHAVERELRLAADVIRSSCFLAFNFGIHNNLPSSIFRYGLWAMSYGCPPCARPLPIADRGFSVLVGYR
jgi:hypothetical protein